MRKLGKAMMGMVLAATTAVPMVAQRDGYDRNRNDRNGYPNQG